MDDYLLKITDLTINAKDKPGDKLVDGASFTLRRNESIGIVGESGSGKSLTALSILGLLPKNLTIRGEILFQHKNKTIDLKNAHEKQLRQIRGNAISIIFQDPLTSLNPAKKCGYQIAEMVTAHFNDTEKEVKNKIEEILKQVRIEDYYRIINSYPFQLSGGQRQRVMIAMALINKPALMIADEPTTALDVTVQKSIITLIKELQHENNNSLIFISHDLGLVRHVADHLIVMEKGKVIESGSRDEIFNNPQHEYTKGLLMCRPTFKTFFRRLPTIADYKNKNVVFTQKTDQSNNSLTETILQVDNINISYSRNKLFRKNIPFQVLQNIQFSVYKGETLGLVGESGSGKTTIGKALLRLISTSNGNIKYHGKDLTAMDKKELKAFRSKVQLIFQDPYASLNPRITAGRAIEEAMRVHGIGQSFRQRKELIIELLENVGLDDKFFHRYPHQMSGGQRQRIVIARALSLKPEFIICDESVSALDVSVQAQVLNLLNELKEKYDLTYIFISHDLAVVKYMSDRVIVLKSGQIMEAGRCDDVFTNPQSDYTRTLIDSVYQI